MIFPFERRESNVPFRYGVVSGRVKESQFFVQNVFSFIYRLKPTAYSVFHRSEIKIRLYSYLCVLTFRSMNIFLNSFHIQTWVSSSHEWVMTTRNHLSFTSMVITKYWNIHTRAETCTPIRPRPDGIMCVCLKTNFIYCNEEVVIAL